MKKALKILGVVVGVVLLLGLLLIVVPREKLLSYLAPDIDPITVRQATITETKATMRAQLDVTSGLIPVFVDSMAYDFRLYDQSVARGRQNHLKSRMLLEPRSHIVGRDQMNADKNGVIDVVDKRQELKEIEKQKKQQEKDLRNANGEPFRIAAAVF